MARREIKAKDIVEDIRAGLDDPGLMHKYRLSSKGLQNLFDELAYLGYIEESEHREVKPAKRRVNAEDLVADIRNGMPLVALQEKHGLSSKGLKKAHKKLVEAGFLQPVEIPADLDSGDARVFEDVRQFERYYLDFDLPIIDAHDPEREGRVHDITETGLQVVGIPSEVNEIKTFLIMHKRFLLIKPFLFDAKCRWVNKSAGAEDLIAGFQITDTPGDDRRQLRKLIRIVRLVL